MIIFSDGSCSTLEPSQRPHGVLRYIHAWGNVVLDDDNHIELRGTRYRPDTGTHEFGAFIEGILYASSKAMPPEAVSFYFDDLAIERIAYSLHPGNYKQAPKALELLALLCEQEYDKATFQITLEYLKHARLMYTPGRYTCVYMLRCHDLALAARNDHLQNGKPQLPIFEEWISNGVITHWNKDGPVTYVPPFSNAVSTMRYGTVTSTIYRPWVAASPYIRNRSRRTHLGLRRKKPLYISPDL